MRYGEVLPEGFTIPTGAFWIRKDLERNPFDLVDVRPGDKVMDCGSCIGTFAVAALEQGAARVWCYEPMEKNVAVLRDNVSKYGDRAVVVRAALTMSSENGIMLSLSGFSGAHTIVPRRKAKEVMVPAKCFRSELMERQPDVLKLDVEGAEYGLMMSLMRGDLHHVRSLFIEFHPNDRREELVEKVKTFVTEEGFVVLKDRLRAFTAVRC